jgi:hypothetical protein
MQNDSSKFKIIFHSILIVIPAKAGIQGFTICDFQLDPGSSPG